MRNMTSDVKYLIAIPCGNVMPVQTVASLTYMNRVGLSRVTFLQNSMVYDARHKLIAEAIATDADRVLFIDSDMTFDSHLMERLAADMDEGRDFVAGLYFRRIFPTNPLLFKTVGLRNDRDISVLYDDYPKDSVFEIGGCGFGAVMISVDMLKAMVDKFKFPFAPMPGVFGEDIAFCYRAGLMGYKLWCDSRIKVGHIGSFIFDEQTYQAQQEVKRGK